MNPEGMSRLSSTEISPGASVLARLHEMHAAVILRGGGMQKKERGYPMSVTDLAPTIAHLLGTPIPRMQRAMF